MIEYVTCCLCGKKIGRKQAHNPWPLIEDARKRCCTECNITKVLPARHKKAKMRIEELSDVDYV